MLESATTFVSSNTLALANSATTLWATTVSTIGLIPTVLISVATVVGIYVCIKWSFNKLKTWWKNRGAQVSKTSVNA